MKEGLLEKILRKECKEHDLDYDLVDAIIQLQQSHPGNDPKISSNRRNLIKKLIKDEIS
tara:strand:- start:779 stop:955 length:177 start_codon:yes stop_codon:yes gene_type:complete